MNNKNWIVYLIRCSDKSLYGGITNDLNSRLIEHNSGKGAKYTKSRRPVELVGFSPEMTNLFGEGNQNEKDESDLDQTALG